MADALLKGGVALARITRHDRNGLEAWMEFESPEPIVKAELNYTVDTGEWQKRTWATIPANLETERKRVSARLPRETTVFFFNITDTRNLVVSSEHEEIEPNKPDAGDGK